MFSLENPILEEARKYNQLYDTASENELQPHT